MEKSEEKSKEPRRLKNGGIAGRGPKKGAPNAGRPRDEWKAWLRSIVDAEETREGIAAILSDHSHPAYAKVLQWAAERGYGKESDHIEHSGEGGGPIAITVTRRVIRPDKTP